MSDQEVKLTHAQWYEITEQVKDNTQQIGYVKDKQKEHGQTIKTLSENHLILPQAIKDAVTEGMAPVLTKVLKHDEMFSELAIAKEREERARAERLLDQEADRRKWFIRTVIGTIVGGIIGPAITILGYIIFNNHP